MFYSNYRADANFALNSSAKAGNYADYFAATKASVDYFVAKGVDDKGRTLLNPTAYRKAAYRKAFADYAELHEAYVAQGVATTKDVAVFGFAGSRVDPRA